MARRGRELPLWPMVAAALVTAAAAVVFAPRAAHRVYPGVDLRDHPGDAAMRRLRGAYRWTGFYLVSANHPGQSWRGTWPRLARMGWGVAVIYVGQEESELTLAQAAADAADAAAQMTAEGFADGTAVFLDVEHVDEVSAEQAAYVGAWARAMRRTAYRPALYCHVANAAALTKEMAEAGAVPLWVAGGSGEFSREASPAASGVEGAVAWQGELDVAEPEGRVAVNVDLSVAAVPSPSED